MWGFAEKELEQSQYGVNDVKVGATRGVCVSRVVVVQRRLEVGEDTVVWK